MAFRLTDSEKWRTVWFRKLPYDYKLLWLYIYENCNHAGIINFDLEIIEAFIGHEYDKQKIRKLFKGKYKPLSNGEKWFIDDFIKINYKNGNLDTNNKVHKSAVDILIQEGLVRNEKALKDYRDQGSFKGHYRVLLDYKEREKEREVVKGKEIEKDTSFCNEYINIKDTDDKSLLKKTCHRLRKENLCNNDPDYTREIYKKVFEKTATVEPAFYPDDTKGDKFQELFNKNLDEEIKKLSA